MKRKTIEKIIASKMEEWLESIDNDSLRKEVKENLLVTGGCITSMFLKEQVNDYDIYIQNMDVLSRLANYYASGLVLDGRLKDKYISVEFPDIEHFDDENDPYVSERYVRLKNLKEDQIKMDVAGDGKRIEYKDEDDIAYKPIFISQNAISLTNDIQIVTRFSGSPEQIHKTFDFIHATNYFTMSKGLVTNIEALECILTKELRYQGSHYPVTSVIRIKKFIGRGWTMNAGEILKILFQISSLDLTDIETLEDQLIGVDVAYFSTLIDALRGVEKDRMTSNYINKIIDRVFSKYDGDYES